MILPEAPADTGATAPSSAVLPREIRPASEPSGIASVDAGLAGKINALAHPDAYPEPTLTVEVIETHLAVVFLTDQHAWKLKKPFRRGAADFTSLAARKRDCMNEVRLNRRLAPRVYLGIAPLVREGGRLQVAAAGRTGEPVDWLVKMRRLPRDQMLDQRLLAGTVTADDATRFMRVLAHFYLRARPIAIPPGAYVARHRRLIADTCGALHAGHYHLDGETIEKIRRLQTRFLEWHYRLLAQRANEHRIIEGHGDLRPEHICLLRRPVIIDCLEFDPDLRILDPADELAGLAVECEYLGATWLRAPIIDTYRRVTADPLPEPVLRFHETQRALVRTRLAAWHLDDQPLPDAVARKWRSRSRDFLALALSHAERMT